MKLSLILSLVLLGTVSSLYLRNEVIMLEKLEEVDIQTEEPKTPERAEALTSADNSSEKKEEATELVSAATDNNILEPKKVDAVYVLGNPGFQTVRHILVRQLKTFTEAQCLAKKFKWIDRSSWHFSYWTTGQPLFGWGCCVALCTNRLGLEDHLRSALSIQVVAGIGLHAIGHCPLSVPIASPRPHPTSPLLQ